MKIFPSVYLSVCLPACLLICLPPYLPVYFVVDSMRCFNFYFSSSSSSSSRRLFRPTPTPGRQAGRQYSSSNIQQKRNLRAARWWQQNLMTTRRWQQGLISAKINDSEQGWWQQVFVKRGCLCTPPRFFTACQRLLPVVCCGGYGYGKIKSLWASQVPVTLPSGIWREGIISLCVHERPHLLLTSSDAWSERACKSRRTFGNWNVDKKKEGTLCRLELLNALQNSWCWGSEESDGFW